MKRLKKFGAIICAIAMLVSSITYYPTSNVSAATWYERLYEQRLEYKQQSVLMQIDPQQVQRGDITFLIQTDIM